MTAATALAGWIAAIERPPPVRVAIDGPDAAGKTTLAAAVAEQLRAVHGRAVCALAADDLLAPAPRRHRQGRLSPAGYFEDAFDLEALRRVVAEAAAAVVVVEGSFLQRPELADLWNGRVWVTASEDERLRRALARDVPRLGTAEAVRDLYERRYLPAQRLYVERCRPHLQADVVVDNEHPASPRLSW